MSKLAKEISIFIGLFLFLTLGMHMKQWIAHPIDHIEHLAGSTFGLFHPLYFTFGIYLALFILRKIFGAIIGLFARKD